MLRITVSEVKLARGASGCGPEQRTALRAVWGKGRSPPLRSYGGEPISVIPEPVKMCKCQRRVEVACMHSQLTFDAEGMSFRELWQWECFSLWARSAPVTWNRIESEISGFQSQSLSNSCHIHLYFLLIAMTTQY